MNELEQLLQRPLPPIKDNGFSMMVIKRVERCQRQRKLVWLLLSALLLIALILIAPSMTWLSTVFDGLTKIAQILPSAPAANFEGLFGALGKMSPFMFGLPLILPALYLLMDAD